MAGFLDQARNLLTSAYSRGSQFIAKNPTPNVFLGQQTENAIASAPFQYQNIKNNLGKNFKTPIDFSALAAEENRRNILYDTSTPRKKLEFNIPYDNYLPIKDTSATPRLGVYTYDNSPRIQTESYLEQIKQKVLSNPNLRPVAKEYLSKIPITYGQVQPGAIAQAEGVGTDRPNVVVSDRFKKQYPSSWSSQRIQDQKKYEQDQLEIIIKHELLHETPRLIPIKLFHPKNQPIINQYANRWKGHISNPKDLIEEMFAESELPPAYYWHIYKQVNPKSTKSNFLDSLRSYFVNNLNTAKFVKTRQNEIKGTLEQATIVPGSGGGKVQYGHIK